MGACRSAPLSGAVVIPAAQQLLCPSQLKAYLHERGLAAQKRLSQNFLCDSRIVDRILDALPAPERGPILEIGPGPGALTQALLRRGYSVTAVELDRGFVRALQEWNASALTVIEADFLALDHAQITPPGGFAAVVSNLPYSITSPALQILLTAPQLWPMCVLMVQSEVAQNIVAVPGSREYGLLSLFVHSYAKPQMLFKVAPACFYPKPKIYSAVIRTDLQPADIMTGQACSLAKIAFGQRRKMLRASLRGCAAGEQLEQCFQQAQVDSSLRPEQLGPQQWRALVVAGLIPPG